MKSCFMFGHRDCPDTILPRIEEAVERCYLNHGVTAFYVGSRGRFDHLAATAVKRVKHRHDDIGLFLLLAYHPGERAITLPDGFDGSFYPPLINVPHPYAIIRANQYMIDTSDYLICYAKHIGNARNLLAYALRKKRGVLIENVADNM